MLSASFGEHGGELLRWNGEEESWGGGEAELYFSVERGVFVAVSVGVLGVLVSLVGGFFPCGVEAPRVDEVVVAILN